MNKEVKDGSSDQRQISFSDNQSIQNIEILYNEQKTIISSLQEQLRQETELKNKFSEFELINNLEAKAKLFNFPDLKSIDKGSKEYVLAKLAKDLENKSEECTIIWKEKEQEIHELKASFDSKQAVIAKQRSIIDENNENIKSLEHQLKTIQSNCSWSCRNKETIQELNENGKTNEEYIDEIQQLNLQLGKKDLIIVKQEKEIKDIRLKISVKLIINSI